MSTCARTCGCMYLSCPCICVHVCARVSVYVHMRCVCAHTCCLCLHASTRSRADGFLGAWQALGRRGKSCWPGWTVIPGACTAGALRRCDQMSTHPTRVAVILNDPQLLSAPKPSCHPRPRGPTLLCHMLPGACTQPRAQDLRPCASQRGTGIGALTEKISSEHLEASLPQELGDQRSVCWALRHPCVVSSDVAPTHPPPTTHDLSPARGHSPSQEFPPKTPLWCPGSSLFFLTWRPEIV